MTREQLDAAYGDKRVQVKLAALHEVIEHLIMGDINSALLLLEVMTAVDQRKQLRQLRNDAYRQYRHSVAIGDCQSATDWQVRIEDIDAAIRDYTA